MKYRLIIDKNKEEEVIAVVHAPSDLTRKIENLVSSYSGADYIMGYREDEMRKLAFKEIECITISERKVIAIDTENNHYRLQERLRDLEEILPSYFIRINKSALAFVAGGVNVVHQMERVPLTVAILIQGIVLYVGYLGTYLVNDWLEWSELPILMFTGIFILLYLVIWGIIYVTTKKNTAELNEKLKQKQQNL